MSTGSLKKFANGESVRLRGEGETSNWRRLGPTAEMCGAFTLAGS
jgi:hypothetical protein